jgi:hypothetical protein
MTRPKVSTLFNCTVLNDSEHDASSSTPHLKKKIHLHDDKIISFIIISEYVCLEHMQSLIKTLMTMTMEELFQLYCAKESGMMKILETDERREILLINLCAGWNEKRK